MRIVVTGASGMIGTALCESLLASGHEVIGADIRENPWNPAVERITGRIDLRDRAACLEKLPGRIDAVFHFAANARVHDLVADPTLARDNVETTFNVLEYCRLRQVPKLVLASSREIYGTTTTGQQAETTIRVEATPNPYAASKVAGEAFAASYASCYQVPVVIVRLSNVYGRYDTSDRVIPTFLRATAAGRDLDIHGGDKVLDFTYLDDCVRGVLAVFERATAGGVFNIASGTATSLLELAEIVRQLVPSPSRVIVGPNRTGEVTRYVADVTRAREVLGFAPTTNLVDGLARTLLWYREHGLVPR